MSNSMMSRHNHLPPVSKEADALLSEFRECAGNVVKNLHRMAEILRRLDELGIKVSIEHPLLPYVRMIAKGTLLAECFLTCSGDAHLLECAERMPLDVQERIAANDKFDVVEVSGQVRSVGALDMSRADRQQVFKRDGVREADEQRSLLASRQSKPSLAITRERAHEELAGVGPRPRVSAVTVEMNWAAKKIVSAALKWHIASEENEEVDQDRAIGELSEACAEYLEVTEAAA